VVNFFGPTELDAADIPEGSRALVRDFVGGTPEQKPELTKAASPIRYVTSDDAPILTFQGTKDPLVPHTQAIKLGDAMTAVGLAGRVELLVGQGHGWGKTEIERTLNQTFLFLDQHLKD
jgi:acetyl esterase/lipase